MRRVLVTEGTIDRVILIASDRMFDLHIEVGFARTRHVIRLKARGLVALNARAHLLLAKVADLQINRKI